MRAVTAAPARPARPELFSGGCYAAGDVNFWHIFCVKMVVVQPLDKPVILLRDYS